MPLGGTARNHDLGTRGRVDCDHVCRFILVLDALQSQRNKARLCCINRSIEVAAQRRGDEARNLIERRRRLGFLPTWIAPAHRQAAHRDLGGDLVRADGYRSSLFPLCLSCNFLLELRGCQQAAEPVKRLIAQPAGRRLTRNQQRNAVRAYVEDVLAAVDATKFGYNEVTERLRRVQPPDL